MTFQYISFTNQLSVKLLFHLFVRILLDHFPNSYVISPIIDSVLIVFLKFVKNLFFLNFRLVLVKTCPFKFLIFKEFLVSILQQVVKDICGFLQMKILINEW